MIKIICGPKGSGKTKTIIDMANKYVETAKGNVVFVSYTSKHSVNISYNIKFIGMEPYESFKQDGFGNFLAGICAGNHDIEAVFIDGAYRVCGGLKPDEMEQFYYILNKVSDIHGVDFYLTVSCDEKDLPPFINKLERA